MTENETKRVDGTADAPAARCSELLCLIESRPDANSFISFNEDEGEWLVTNEWLCGAFAGRAFVTPTNERANGIQTGAGDINMKSKDVVVNTTLFVVANLVIQPLLLGWDIAIASAVAQALLGGWIAVKMRFLK